MAKVKVLSTTFKIRRGQSSAFAKNNPILQAGEPGYELDTHKLKIGDGATAWNDLPYIAHDSEEAISSEKIQSLFKTE